MSGYNPRNANASVTVVGIDPGSTTGIAIISIDARWVRGGGEPSYDALGKAIRSKVAYQIGRDPKALYEGVGAASKVTNEELDERMLPIYANQPAHEDHGTRRDDRFRAIMGGEQFFGGALTSADAGEIVQVRQVSGLLENYSNAAIVIEDFVLRTAVRSREVTSPDRIRFAITMNEILHGSGRTPFLQQPAYAKTTATDERLKRADLWFAGMPHACDAARHVLTFLRDSRQHEELRAHAWPHKFADFFDED